MLLLHKGRRGRGSVLTHVDVAFERFRCCPQFAMQNKQKEVLAQGALPADTLEMQHEKKQGIKGDPDKE